MRAISRHFVLVAAIASAVAGRPATAQTPPVTVTIDGTPVTFDQPPVEQAGRVYVPLRGVFERLGAAVVYDRGHINATKGPTMVSLSVGSALALVNGQEQHLDSPPLVVGERVLVPLRFVSQALGTTVNFVQATQTVAITVPAAVPRRLPRRTLAAAPAGGPLGTLSPAPDAVVAPSVAQISAHFTQPVNARSVRATIDGVDITSGIYVTARDLIYSVTIPLKAGQHTVLITGSLAAGSAFSRGWSFRTVYDQFVRGPQHRTAARLAQTGSRGVQTSE